MTTDTRTTDFHMAARPECDKYTGPRKQWCLGDVKDKAAANRWRIALGHTPLTSTTTDAKSQEQFQRLTEPIRNLGLKTGSITAIHENGWLKWERMDGLGDLFTAILRRLWIEKRIRIFIEWRYGSACGCARRQAEWNQRFPFPPWVQRGIRLLLGPWTRLE